jgi:hypothetical protein
VLALTCCAQLRILQASVPAPAGRLPAVYPLLAQLTGWSAITIAIAAWIDRSRYAELSGAVAAPLSFAVIGIAWYTPALNHLLVTPPGSSHTVTLSWYAVAGGAALLTTTALRDRWHRHPRVPHRVA